MFFPSSKEKLQLSILILSLNIKLFLLKSFSSPFNSKNENNFHIQHFSFLMNIVK